MGFNICMVARDKVKMDNICKTIEQTSNVKTRTIVCDFSVVHRIE